MTEFFSYTKHPLRGALLCLMIVVVSSFDALYLRQKSIAVVDWAWCVMAGLGCVACLLNALSDHLYSSDE